MDHDAPRAQGPCRDLLDWLTDQVSVLHAHTRRIEEDGGDPDELDLVDDAHRWLNRQLAEALEARGVPIAA